MYTGTLIEDLMNTVAQAEERGLRSSVREERVEFWYAAAQNQMAQVEPMLAGVA